MQMGHFPGLSTPKRVKHAGCGGCSLLVPMPHQGLTPLGALARCLLGPFPCLAVGKPLGQLSKGRAENLNSPRHPRVYGSCSMHATPSCKIVKLFIVFPSPCVLYLLFLFHSLTGEGCSRLLVSNYAASASTRWLSRTKKQQQWSCWVEHHVNQVRNIIFTAAWLFLTTC